METDPVCLMPLDAAVAEFRMEYKGHEYCFCSAGCFDKFKRNPKDYV